MSGTRTEKDTFGPIEVPSERLWDAATGRGCTSAADVIRWVRAEDMLGPRP